MDFFHTYPISPVIPGTSHSSPFHPPIPARLCPYSTYRAIRRHAHRPPALREEGCMAAVISSIMP
jgi:hypothetical protein